MAHSVLLSSPPIDDHMKLCNKEFYSILIFALMKESRMHLLNGVSNHDGHKAWSDIIDWYGSVATSRSIIDHYYTKLKGLQLEKKNEANKYVSDLILCCQKLDSKSKGHTSKTNCQQLINQITSSNYIIVKQ